MWKVKRIYEEWILYQEKKRNEPKKGMGGYVWMKLTVK